MSVYSREQFYSVNFVSGVATPSVPTIWYFDMRDLHHFGGIFSWTGSLVGTWKLRSGAHFYGVDQIATFPGVWSDVTASLDTPMTNPANLAADFELSHPDWTALWAEVSLASISGTGVLTLALTGKE